MHWRRDRVTPSASRPAGGTCGRSDCDEPRWGSSALCDGHTQEAQANLRAAEARQDEQDRRSR